MNSSSLLVDLETGQVKIEKIPCSIDVVKAINPQQVLTPNLSTSLAPTALVSHGR